MTTSYSCDRQALIEVTTLRQQYLQGVSPMQQVSRVPLSAAPGRVLAEDLLAAVAQPPFSNAAMDGFAVRTADIPSSGTVLPSESEVFAGDASPSPLTAGMCQRIMTGARLPAGADAVVMQEDVTVTDAGMVFGVVPKPGQHIRWASEDIAVGTSLLRAGTRLCVSHTMLLASQGVVELPVVAAPTVAVMSTGDELVSGGTALRDGQIYDSNRQYLLALLRSLGIDVVDLGIVPDVPDAISEALATAAAAADVVVTTGGVSVGKRDFLKEQVSAQGAVGYWRVRLKPGKPLALGRLGQACYVGLPGNPVSTMVCAQLFLVPLLRHLQQDACPGPEFEQATLAMPVQRKAGREEYVRAVRAGSMVTPLPRQGSADLSSLSTANVLIRLPHDQAVVEAGQAVAVLPLF